VAAPITGSATTIRIRSRAGVPPEARLEADVAGIDAGGDHWGAWALPQSISSRNAGM
jgi:hypothetical protein